MFFFTPYDRYGETRIAVPFRTHCTGATAVVTKFYEDAQVTSDFESRDSDQDQSYCTVIQVSFRN